MPEKNWPLITGRERGGGALQNRRAGAKSKFGVGGKMLSMLNGGRGGGGGGCQEKF